MTIRKKLILLYSGLLALVVIAFGVVVFGVIRSMWIESVDSTLKETAEQVLLNSRAYPIREFGSPVRIGIELPQLDIFRASGVMVQAWSISSDGTPMFGQASDNLGEFRDPLDPATLGAEGDLYSTVYIRNIELRVLTSPIRVLGQERLFGNMQVAASLETLNEATNKLAFFIVGASVLAMLASVGLGTWLSSQSLRPIEDITRAADSISTAKDLQTRLDWRGPEDELGRLVRVFNRMMDRLEHLFGVQRRLVADVSHELRTPLTAIRGNLDLIKRYGVDESSLEAIESETARMQRLVNDLLLLARADYGSPGIDLTEVDVDTVVTDVFKEAHVLTKDHPLRLTLARIDPVRIKGNSDRLKQLLLNLVGNSIKFTPDGGEITLALWREGNEAVLTVTDTGVGIQPENIERIFDRFYQADESRSRVHTGEGAGLGLAIAKWIVEAHGGTISVESIPNQRTTFTVRLPIPDAQPEAVEPVSEAARGYLAAMPKIGLPRRKRAASEPTLSGK